LVSEFLERKAQLRVQRNCREKLNRLEASHPKMHRLVRPVLSRGYPTEVDRWHKLLHILQSEEEFEQLRLVDDRNYEDGQNSSEKV